MTEDAPLRRLWQRVSRRFPAAREARLVEALSALSREDPEGAYALLHPLSAWERPLQGEQVRLYLVQGGRLVRALGPGAVSTPFLLETLGALSAEAGQRWLRFGWNRLAAGDGRAYFRGEDPQGRRLFQGLHRGLAAREVERVLRFYAEALAAGVQLRFDELERAPVEGACVRLPARVTAYPAAVRSEEDPHFALYKWLLTHELGHREAGTYRLGGATTPAAGHAALAAAVRAFPEPALAEGLFHLFENVRVEGHLLRQYPGLRAEHARLLELERAFRPVAPTGRAGFLEALLQTLYWDGPAWRVPPAWSGPLSALGREAQALRQAGGRVEDALVLTERAYRLLEALFPEPEAVEVPTLLPHEPRLHLDRTPPPAPPRARSQARGRLRGGEADAELGEEACRQAVPGARVYRYDEWDYRTGVYRRGWCALHEGHPAEREAEPLASPAAARRVRRAFEWFAEEDWTRQRFQLEGDEPDLEAWVQGVIERRAGVDLPEKLYSRRLRKRRDLCVAVLLDQSDSTARLTPEGRPVIALEREALGYLCEALEVLRDEYALYAYSGEGRDGVRCWCLKGFEEPYGPSVRRRLAALEPLAQNRDGCALRHVSRILSAREARTKLLLHLTDGRPWDHGYQRRYALEDTKRAIREARAAGIKVFGVICDPHAPSEARATYAGRAVVLNRLDALSELLLGLYHKVTR